MKALFPKQTNFAVSNFLTKAERLQERYLKYWLNLLLCNSIASIAVLEQTKPAIFCLQFFVKLSEILNSCSVFLQQPNLTCCVYCMLSHMSSFLSAQLSCSRCGRVGFPQTIFMRIRKVALGSNFGFTYFTLKFYIVVQCFQLTFLVGLASTPITGNAL